MDVRTEIGNPSEGKFILKEIKKDILNIGKSKFEMYVEQAKKGAEARRVRSQILEDERRQQEIKRWKDREWKNIRKEDIETTREQVLEVIKPHLAEVGDDFIDELSDTLFWLREAEVYTTSLPQIPQKRNLFSRFRLSPSKAKIALRTFTAISNQPPNYHSKHPHIMNYLVDQTK